MSRSSSFDMTLDYCGHTLHVKGSIAPAEKATWSEWDGGDPGCDAHVEDCEIFLVHEVKAGGTKERLLEDPKGEILHDIHNDIMDAVSDDAEQDLEDARERRYWDRRVL